MTAAQTTATPMPRTSLADQQAALVAALTGAGPVPPGFDPARIHAAAAALAAKRARAVLQVWPGVRRMLGSDFRARFDAYAAHAALPERGGPLADGRAFVRALGAQMPLSDEVKLQALAVDRHWQHTPRGLVPRTTPHMAFAHLRSVRCVVVTLGARELRLPLPRLR
jgi:hypothetical protein